MVHSNAGLGYPWPAGSSARSPYRPLKARNPESRAVKLTLLAVATLIVMSGATITPSLPAMEAHFAGVPNVEILVRLVATTPALFIVLGAPAVGYIADRWGRKRLLAFLDDPVRTGGQLRPRDGLPVRRARREGRPGPGCGRRHHRLHHAHRRLLHRVGAGPPHGAAIGLHWARRLRVRARRRGAVRHLLARALLRLPHRLRLRAPRCPGPLRTGASLRSRPRRRPAQRWVRGHRKRLSGGPGSR